MILTAADKPLYFPDCPLSGSALTAAIARAQMTAESAKGANRPLELQAFSEIRPISRTSQTCQLSRFPVVELPAPVLKARSRGFKDGFGRIAPATDWQALSADSYTIDYETGAVHLVHTSFGRGWNTPLTELQATYSSGFDFSIVTPETQAIKSAVATILICQTLSL